MSRREPVVFNQIALFEAVIALSGQIEALGRSLDPDKADHNSIALIQRLIAFQDEMKSLLQYLDLADAIEGYLTAPQRPE